MCEQCEAQFDAMTERFDGLLSNYLKMQTAGETRDTPAERVHDLAFTHQWLCNMETGRVAISWFLALAMERLAALETAGIPT
jgi:hypothetical protein